MRTYFLSIGLLIFSLGQVAAQRSCYYTEHMGQQLSNNPSLSVEVDNIENFIQRQLTLATSSRLVGTTTIKIPVVVHILYHLPDENISDEKVYGQIDMLNKCYRRTNADTVNTPAVFKSRAADCEIEFELAISDPLKRSTTGIIHKYTPVSYWQANDQMKFSDQMGDDAWDSRFYLNIWVCNIRKVAGYSSVPGDVAAKDGIVIDYTIFGTNSSSGYELGRTAVHEAGHWLGLRHIWGDADCGDDFVDDTPKQRSYNIGCPTGSRITCNNGPAGDMYTNYMDYSNDACVNLFTEGQKTRMKALFALGGPRYSILSSHGLNAPLNSETPLPDEAPRWLHPQLYPNPATNELILDVAYDIRWVGKTLSVFNANGQLVIQTTIKSKIQKIDIQKLRPGLYIMSARKEDGSYIKQKFIKL
ncbi:MAG: M43 family zinc metalloprotease [Chitinophagales bacterium]